LLFASVVLSEVAEGYAANILETSPKVSRGRHDDIDNLEEPNDALHRAGCVQYHVTNIRGETRLAELDALVSA
jgi:hypothetical protein